VVALGAMEQDSGLCLCRCQTARAAADDKSTERLVGKNGRHLWPQARGPAAVRPASDMMKPRRSESADLPPGATGFDIAPGADRGGVRRVRSLICIGSRYRVMLTEYRLAGALLAEPQGSVMPLHTMQSRNALP